MEVALSVIRYLFVGTVFIGGSAVLWALARLAWEKAQSQTTPEDRS